MGALTGRATGAIGHRDEIGGQRRQAVDRVPEIALHLLRLGREELERDFWRLQHALPIGRGNGKLGHDFSKNPWECGQQAYRVEPKIGQTRGSKQPIGIGKLPNYAIYGVLIGDFSDWWEATS